MMLKQQIIMAIKSLRKNLLDIQQKQNLCFLSKVYLQALPFCIADEYAIERYKNHP